MKQHHAFLIILVIWVVGIFTDSDALKAVFYLVIALAWLIFLVIAYTRWEGEE